MHSSQVDEQRRRAEADKLAAITELETRSREFMKEKTEKRALEEKIAGLQGQLLVGGRGIEETPQFRCANSSQSLRILRPQNVQTETIFANDLCKYAELRRGQ